ncbi:hypothetical protein CYY_009647 [Polysphondylium violaceum]|uniref:Uncharacterized protein n=1 Tax=Polysphondylium violaceum TaxID=133409 RepID=A0A8J4PMI2_9MYCE|nr:hypothetical protein CYY_009647 [Polysphondylium violaceum]
MDHMNNNYKNELNSNSNSNNNDINDLLVNILSSLYEIIYPCYGINGRFQMLVGESNEKKQQKVILTKKASEILKNIVSENVFINIVKKSIATLESVCFDGSATLVLLIYSLYRESVYLLDNGIHPISLIYAYQKSFAQIDSALDRLRIPLLRGIENPNQIENDMNSNQILDIKLSDIDQSLLRSTINTTLQTKLDSIDCSSILDCCMEITNYLFLNKELNLSIKDIMKKRISFQDQIIINTKRLSNNNSSDKDNVSFYTILKNGFFIDSIHFIINSQQEDNKSLENMKIIFLNQDIAMDGMEDSSKPTKMVFNSVQERSMFYNQEKEKLRKNLQLLNQYLGDDNCDGNTIIINEKDIDEYSKSLFHQFGFKRLYKNVNSQMIKQVLNSCQIHPLNSLSSLPPFNEKNKEYFYSHHVGRVEKVDFKPSSTYVGLKKMDTFFSSIKGSQGNEKPFVSLEITGSTSSSLHSRVGSFIIGMGVVKCCIEDLFSLPSACATEFAIIKHLQQCIESDDLGLVEKKSFGAMIKAIEILPKTILNNHSLPILKTMDAFNNRNLLKERDSSHFIGINIKPNGLNDYFIDSKQAGILETYRSKTQIFRYLIDIVSLLLKIDQIIPYQPRNLILPPQFQKERERELKKTLQQQEKEAKENREYIRFKTPKITSEYFENEKLQHTKKLNQLFYLDEQVEKRKKFEKYTTNQFSK